MKFETTPAFDADYRRLKAEHRVTFRTVLAQKFAPACDACASDPSRTWSFASPDGRATFELPTVENELRCRWRRVGDHAVDRSP